ncbi:hypothetical protein MRX96_029011 [Rhipicephalus microplus]
MATIGGASRFVRQVRRLCYRGELGRGVFYLDHAFHEMPLWRVLATDGLDPSYKGVAMLALHFRELLTTKTSRWHPQNLQPAENAAPRMCRLSSACCKHGVRELFLATKFRATCSEACH